MPHTKQVLMRSLQKKFEQTNVRKHCNRVKKLSPEEIFQLRIQKDNE